MEKISFPGFTISGRVIEPNDCLVNEVKTRKSEVASKPVVQPYSRKKQETITTDAFEKAIRGVLSQQGHPVLYVSRTVYQAEQTYSAKHTLGVKP